MTKLRRLYSVPYYIWLLLFVIAPVLLIIYQSFFDDFEFRLVRLFDYIIYLSD